MADESYKVETELSLKTTNARTNAKAAALVFDDLGKKVDWLGREFMKGAGSTRHLGRALGVGNQRLAKIGSAAAKAGGAFDRFAVHTDKASKSTQHMGNRAPEALSKVSSAMSRLGSRIRMAGTFSSSLLTRLLAIGGAYLGIRSLVGHARGFVMEAIRANSAMEDMLVTLATLRASIDRMSFDAALAGSVALQRQLNIIAAQSPATGSQLTEIFTGVYGPMRRAGTGMQDLLEFTQNAASVGRVLGVDYQQLSRDVSMMATGVAGTDVKTFRLLRSMGLLTQSTEEWNRMAIADPARAARELTRAFRELGGPAAAAFGRTWTGASSTFAGLIEHFMRILTAPAFTKLVTRLRQVNTFLLRYREKLERLLMYVGDRISRPFDRLMTRAGAMFRYVITNMNAITARIDMGIQRLVGMLPALRRMASTMALFMVVARVVGPLIGGIGALGSMLSGLSGIGGLLGIGGGAAATAAGGGAAVAGGGALATIGAVLAPVVVGLGIAIATVIGLFASFWAAGSRWWSELSKVMAPLGQALRTVGSILWQFGSIVFDLVYNVLSFIGAELLVLLWPAISLVSSAFNVLGPYLQVLMASWRVNVARFTNRIERMGQGVFAFMQEVNRATGGLQGFTALLQRLGFATITFAPSATPAGGGWLSDIMSRAEHEFRQGMAAFETPGGTPTTGQQPPGRGGTTIDMRNSRITVHQEFRDAAPDRIMVDMMDDVGRQAIARRISPFAPALTH